METKIDKLRKYALKKEELVHLKGGRWEKTPEGEYVWIDD